MRVGYDIDGVLADFGNHFLNYLDLEDKSPFTSWEDYRIDEHFHKLHYDFKFWLTIPPLIKGEELPYRPAYYVTARPIPSKITEQWLELNGFPKAPVKTVGINGDKVEFLKSKKVDLFFDDAVHNFKVLNNGGVNCYLVTRTHNEKFLTEKRVDDLRNFKLN